MKLLQILILSFAVSVTAQTKVGTIDIDFVLAQMPEILDVQKKVEEYGKTLDSDLSKKMGNYQSLVNEYAKNDPSYTAEQRKIMQDSIIGVEGDINKFRQNATQLIGLKRDEELQPLYTKIGASLEKVAQTEGYTQVMERSNILVYIDNRFDLTLAVLKDMGIEVKEEE
jgi:outer membrane protein